MPAELQYTWKGTTTFTLKDGFESTLEDVVAPPPEHPETLQEAREQGADHNLSSLQSKRWTNTHLHTCPTGVGVPFASKQKAREMPPNNNSQSSQSYRLTLHTSRHLQMNKALQYLQQLMYNHNYAWHWRYQTKQRSMTT